ncbi:protein of unknown function [Geodermatophilus africanus]|uniref:DUF4386 domain-containing protein n=1 Tax=Geodermatophilus africanus TaxID=1137993 RepID=A0A1H3N118_9ACTN|nr:DUF4386 domain-containing protein [Geodermatophilus africanus]SDY82536.1 protein of unknown function [Geodermatophilus africanus]
MSISSPPAATTRPATDAMRQTAFLGGLLYVITFAASIPAAFYFLAPVLNNPDYVLGSGSDARVITGGLLDVVTAIAGIGTAVVLFPVVRRQNRTLALGFVTSRLLEAAIIVIGVVSLLAIVTLRKEFAAAPGVDTDSLSTTAASLVAVRDFTFHLGPGFLAAVNALLLGSLMYRSGLVPRVIPVMGLIGAPLLLAAKIATVYGVNDDSTMWSVIALAPIFFWELSLGIYLIVRGFRPSAVAALPPVEAVR